MQEINVRQAEHIFPENLKLLRQTFKNKGLRQATFHIQREFDIRIVEKYM